VIAKRADEDVDLAAAEQFDQLEVRREDGDGEVC